MGRHLTLALSLQGEEIALAAGSRFVVRGAWVRRF